MLLRLLSIASIIFIIAGCSSTPKETASSSDTGATTTTTAIEPAITPGSSEDLIINVGDRVFFEYDSHELTSDAQDLIHDQASWLKQYGDVTITVEGHCDERGTREYNIALGERRAQAMKNYLIGLGVVANRISTISYGKERPAVLGSTDAAWSQNRRAVAAVN